MLPSLTLPQVKLLKCLVDNLVVDVSFNQMGGLFTYAFLEDVNSLVKPSHILKLSIILVRTLAGRQPHVVVDCILRHAAKCHS